VKASMVALLILSLQQVSSFPGGSIEGHLVRLGTSDPVGGARVVLAKVGGELSDYRFVTSDQSGAFALRNLAAGSYRVYTERFGYLQPKYRGSGGEFTGMPVALADGQKLSNIVITMTPSGVIAGRVRDPEQKPLRNVWIRAMKAEYYQGRRSLELVEFAQTNDLGDYRIFELPPGLYFVSAELNRPRIQGENYIAPNPVLQINGSARDYQFQSNTPGEAAIAGGSVSAAAFDKNVFFRTYFPNTINSDDAAPVELRAGATLTGVDFSISPKPTVHVRGKVISAASAQRLPTVWLDSPQLSVYASVRDMGAFDFPAVPAGKYDLWSSQGTSPATSLAGTIQIEVADRDIENVTLALRPGFTIQGRMTIDGRRPSSSDPKFGVQVLGRTGPRCCSVVAVQSDGTFTVNTYLTPNEYRFRIFQGNDYAYVKSAHYGSEDALDASFRVDGTSGPRFEINVSLRTGTLDVLVADEKQVPVTGVSVVAVPEPTHRKRFEYYPTAITNNTGRAHFDRIEPGDYQLFASREIETTAWQDPDFMRLYEYRGQEFRIQEGEKKDVTLKLTPGRD
jgi:hypothetical protein